MVILLSWSLLLGWFDRFDVDVLVEDFGCFVRFYLLGAIQNGRDSWLVVYLLV